MSGINIITGEKPVADAKIAVVASRYNGFIVDRLLDGCVNTLRNADFEESSISLVRVPGAFEIPVAAKRLAESGNYDAIITLGAVIRGETPHFDYICNECVRGLTNIALSSNIPVIFGVLTVDNIQQAEDRSGDEESNKGSEAANTALDMIGLFRKI